MTLKIEYKRNKMVYTFNLYRIIGYHLSWGRKELDRTERLD